jgi:hypothetical protein
MEPRNKATLLQKNIRLSSAPLDQRLNASIAGSVGIALKRQWKTIAMYELL